MALLLFELQVIDSPLLTNTIKSTFTDKDSVDAVVSASCAQILLADSPSVIVISFNGPAADPSVMVALPKIRKKPAVLMIVDPEFCTVNGVTSVNAIALAKSVGKALPSAVGVRSITGKITFDACKSSPKPCWDGMRRS